MAEFPKYALFYLRKLNARKSNTATSHHYLFFCSSYSRESLVCLTTLAKRDKGSQLVNVLSTALQYVTSK